MAGILPFGAMFIELFFIFSVSTAGSPPLYVQPSTQEPDLLPSLSHSASCSLKLQEPPSSPLKLIMVLTVRTVVSGNGDMLCMRG